MSMTIIHFLLIYNLAERKLETVKQFQAVNDAVHAYEAAERQYLGRNTHEVVLLGADSIEAIMTTHGAYFDLQPGIVPRAGLSAQMSAN